VLGRAARGLSSCALLGALLVSGLARAGEPAASDPAEQIRRLQQAIASQQQKIEQQNQVLSRQFEALEQQRRDLAQQQKQLETLQAALSPANAAGAGGESPSASDSAPELPSVAQGPQPPRPVEPQTTPAPSEPAPAPGETPAPSEGEGAGGERPKSQRALEQLLLEAGAVLLPQGVVQVEPGVEYDHFSNSFVALNGLTLFDAITIGTIRVDRVDQDLVSNTWNLRYGVLNRLQWEAKLPLSYRSESDVLKVGTPTPKDRQIENYGIGDVETALLWHALYGHGALPSVILNARARFPTGESPYDIGTEVVETDDSGAGTVRVKKPALGSGFFTVSPGFTGLWRTDPVVFFAGGTYDINIERDQGSKYHTIDPGDTFQGFLGMNISLSERVSLNFSFVDSYTWSTYQDGHKVDGSSYNDGRLLIGSSIGVNPWSSLILSTAIGLTEQSPDFQVIARVPMTFRVPFLANLFRD
jgi:hypothetical protein